MTVTQHGSHGPVEIVETVIFYSYVKLPEGKGVKVEGCHAEISEHPGIPKGVSRLLSRVQVLTHFFFSFPSVEMEQSGMNNMISIDFPIFGLDLTTYYLEGWWVWWAKTFLVLVKHGRIFGLGASLVDGMSRRNLCETVGGI